MLKKTSQIALNDQQRLAVDTIRGPLLIIAGAGSGKTRVVTSRIAHMISQGISEKNILALTFTNKAAREMRERIALSTGKQLKELTVSTFHAFGVKLLHRYAPLLGYERTFSIYDEVDKTALMKEIVRETGGKTENVNFYELSRYISSVKLGRATGQSDGQSDKFYEEYIEHLKAYSAFDFDDLIALPILLFSQYPDALAECREAYSYILVDEFQDTSMAQYRIISTLAKEHRNLCVVGDDDQSIYSWRGANYENIQHFEHDFPERIEIKLEQNYRSASDILDVANKLISNNKNRKQKALWTGNKGSNSIELIFPTDEKEEGEFITRTIRTQAIRRGISFGQFGILVRTNTLMAAIEETLIADNIAYKVSGGMSFFQRKEIRDLICYLKVFANPDDDMSLLRILNVPRRGIGKTTIQHLRKYASSRSLSLYPALCAISASQTPALSSKIINSLSAFRDLIDTYRERMLAGSGLSQTLSDFVSDIGYWGYLLSDHPGHESLAKFKYSNVQRFTQMMADWEKDQQPGEAELGSYLTRISLVTMNDLTQDDDRNKVNLMTIHAAKGLEFAVVFIAGAEDTILPHARAIEENPDSIEEERRLFYVAITRAKEKLFISSCKYRRIMREKRSQIPTRFLEEIPEEFFTIHQDDTPVSGDDAAGFFAALKAKIGKPS